MPLYDTPDDLDCLTPAHFLIQRPSYLVPRRNTTNEKIPYGKRWERLTQAVQHIWNAWSNDYLVSLQQRKKWLRITRDFKVGDIVLVRHELSAPGKWPLARIIAVHPGHDGRVRVVTLKTATSTMQRPIVKLVLLLEQGDQKDVDPARVSPDATSSPQNSSIDEGRRNVQDSSAFRATTVDQSQALPTRKSARAAKRAVNSQ